MASQYICRFTIHHSHIMKHRCLFFFSFCFILLSSNAQESATDLIAKGVNAEKIGLDQRALDYYSQAVAAAPDNPEPLLLLGKLQYRRAQVTNLLPTNVNLSYKFFSYRTLFFIAYGDIFHI